MPYAEAISLTPLPFPELLGGLKRIPASYPGFESRSFPLGSGSCSVVPRGDGYCREQASHGVLFFYNRVLNLMKTSWNCSVSDQILNPDCSIICVPKENQTLSLSSAVFYIPCDGRRCKASAGCPEGTVLLHCTPA